MKILIDFFPILVFFIIYQVVKGDNPDEAIYAATKGLLIASVVQLLYLHFIQKKIEKSHWLTFALILVLGTLTLTLRDPKFVGWKPTLVNWGFAIAFLGSLFIGKKTLLERMMSQAMLMPHNKWQQLTLIWSAFFIFSGALNLYVYYNYPQETWVNFKMFGMLGVTFIFMIGQSIYLYKADFVTFIEDPEAEIKKEDDKNAL